MTHSDGRKHLLSFSLSCLFNRSTCFWHCNHHLSVLSLSLSCSFSISFFDAGKHHVVIFVDKIEGIFYTFKDVFKSLWDFIKTGILAAAVEIHFLITAKFITTSIFGSATTFRNCLRLISRLLSITISTVTSLLSQLNNNKKVDNKWQKINV